MSQPSAAPFNTERGSDRQGPSRRPQVQRIIQVSRMLAYFLLVVLGGRILQEILQEISSTAYIDELGRVSGTAAAILDVNKNVDDLIITFFALATTFLLSVPVAWVHALTKSEAPDPSLSQALVVLSVIVAGVMLLLEDNLARAFSLVGVVAAVRYRNNLIDPKDAAYVFLALAIGMACGLQAFHVGVLLCVFACAILLMLWVFRTGAPTRGEQRWLEALWGRVKKRERSPAEAIAWLPADARERLEAELETRSRYLALAAQYPARGKRPDCVLTVQTNGSRTARDAFNAELDEHRGRWRLLDARNVDGVTTIEYLGWVGKRRSPPVGLLERLRAVDPGVLQVEFRSLRSALPDENVYAQLDDGVAPRPWAPSLDWAGRSR